jgi:FAD/FMN-containing dehydrogenase
MRELYRAAADRNLMIVGGASTTVSVGGYLTGGGHSPLSPLFGMGADNVIQLEIVTADGKLVVANECSQRDLFWAVRGVSWTSSAPCADQFREVLRLAS